MWGNEQRKAYIRNVAGHIKNVKNVEIIDRQRTLFDSLRTTSKFTSAVTVSIYAAVDQGLSDGIAKAVGRSPVKPLQVKPASEAIQFRARTRFVHLLYNSRFTKTHSLALLKTLNK